MNTTAIRQAIKYYKHPLEMSGIISVHSALPSGVTDLLRLCAFEKQMDAFAVERNIDADMLYNVLTHFIETVLFKEGCSSYKVLGVDKESDTDLFRLHHQLLMKIYHPDRNRSTSSTYYSSKISKAYESLRKPDSTLVSDSEDRTYYEPPRSFYQATQKAQTQINQTRNALLAIASIVALTLVTTLIYLNRPDSSRLIVRNQTLEPLNFFQSKAQISPVIDHANYKNTASKNIHGKKMQLLLHELETAYEQGDVKKITPILANSPELRQKSNQELSSKLETLFRITEERKMVLYNFSWETVAGHIKGSGQFLSRYLLVGEDQWQTRTGLATISAETDSNNKIHITTLDMNDQSIQQ